MKPVEFIYNLRDKLESRMSEAEAYFDRYSHLMGIEDSGLRILNSNARALKGDEVYNSPFARELRGLIRNRKAYGMRLKKFRLEYNNIRRRIKGKSIRK